MGTRTGTKTSRNLSQISFRRIFAAQLLDPALDVSGPLARAEVNGSRPRSEVARAQNGDRPLAKSDRGNGQKWAGKWPKVGGDWLGARPAGWPEPGANQLENRPAGWPELGGQQLETRPGKRPETGGSPLGFRPVDWPEVGRGLSQKWPSPPPKTEQAPGQKLRQLSGGSSVGFPAEIEVASAVPGSSIVLNFQYN